MENMLIKKMHKGFICKGVDTFVRVWESC